MELSRVLHHGGRFCLGWVPTCLHISRVVDHRLLPIVLGPVYALGQLPRIFVDLRLKHLLMLFTKLRFSLPRLLLESLLLPLQISAAVELILVRVHPLGQVDLGLKVLFLRCLELDQSLLLFMLEKEPILHAQLSRALKLTLVLVRHGWGWHPDLHEIL